VTIDTAFLIIEKNKHLLNTFVNHKYNSYLFNGFYISAIDENSYHLEVVLFQKGTEIKMEATKFFEDVKTSVVA